MIEPAVINYPISTPARPGNVEITWGMDSVVAVSESLFTYQQQVYEWPGQRWKCAVKLPPMQLADAQEWMAFFAMLNGQAGTFLLGDSQFARIEVGANLGDPETDGAQAPGRSLVTKGWTPGMLVARPGAWLEIAGRLRRVLLPTYSDEAGKASLAVWPNITALETGVPINWLNPKGTFRLAADVETTWDRNRMMSGIQFAATEVL